MIIIIVIILTNPMSLGVISKVKKCEKALFSNHGGLGDSHG